LGRQQKPHTLFIGCSDSRVVPNLITGSDPGELFIVRNVATSSRRTAARRSMWPPTSAVEYAVLALGVDTIVVCGHSTAALRRAEPAGRRVGSPAACPQVAGSVTRGQGRVDRLMTVIPPEEREWLTEQVNVLVADEEPADLPLRPRSATNATHGGSSAGHYLIETGEIYNFNDATQLFETDHRT